jgi:hypothetical protein
MDAGNGKSSDFRLSQALAYGVVRKGVCGDFILCGLSPPVSAGWSTARTEACSPHAQLASHAPVAPST